MGRPRRYATNAERQRAFRQRRDQTTCRVDRVALDRLHARLDRLQQALRGAADCGDPTARRCYAASIDTLLDRLAAHFQAPAALTATPEDG